MAADQRTPVDLGLVLGLADSAFVVVPVLDVQPGRFGRARLGGLPHAAVVVSGVLLRSVHLRQREGALLHGPGDVLAAVPDEPGPFRAESRALTPARLAVLDPPAMMELSRSFALADALAERVALQSDWAGLQVVLMQLPSIEDRLAALLPELSTRLGTVTTEGITLPAYLSHTVLAALIGVRRPSLTTALGLLEARGGIQRLPDRRWRLTPALAGVA